MNPLFTKLAYPYIYKYTFFNFHFAIRKISKRKKLLLGTISVQQKKKVQKHRKHHLLVIVFSFSLSKFRSFLYLLYILKYENV